MKQCMSRFASIKRKTENKNEREEWRGKHFIVFITNRMIGGGMDMQFKKVQITEFQSIHDFSVTDDYPRRDVEDYRIKNDG